ncbi:hypothetical protein D3C73_1495190 [compost metagenome]
MWPIRPGTSPKKPDTWLPITSLMTGAAPLYGTCSTLALLESANISRVRCGMLPMPDEPMATDCEAARDFLTKSAASVAGLDGFTTNTVALFTTRDTGAKSRTGS